MSEEQQYLNLPPRLQPNLPQGELEIPLPPDETSSYQQTPLELLLPLVMVGGYIVMAISGQGRSLFLIIPMGLAMVLSVYVSLRRVEQAKEELKQRKQAYQEQLSEIRETINEQHEQQRGFYNYNYPSVTMTIAVAQTQDASRLGPRKWERRTSDPDFGRLRLGLGSLPASVQYGLASSGGANNPDPELLYQAQRLLRDAMSVEQIPVTLQMYAPLASRESSNDMAKHHLMHTLGIFGSAGFAHNGAKPNDPRGPVYDYVRALLAHYMTFHSPADAQLYVVGSAAAKRDWQWLRAAPHVQLGADSLMCFDDDEVQYQNDYVQRLPLFLKELLKTLQKRQQRLEDENDSSVALPFLLVVIDLMQVEEAAAANGRRNGQTPPDQADSAKDDEREDKMTAMDVRDSEVASLIMQAGLQLGVAVIFLTRDAAALPTDVKGVIEIEAKPNAQEFNAVSRYAYRANMTFRYEEVGVNTPRYVGQADYLPQKDAAQFCQSLSQHKVRLNAARALVSTLDLLQMNNVGRIDEMHILEQWRMSRTPQKADWPEVPIGFKAGNDVRALRFEANADGVHGMIAGTTGSGKSELLLTLIVGLAAKYDPSIVNFVLVDFKGGAAFEDFRTLPHCVDIVTNLEGNAVDRMFSAIKAELDRRGALIAETGMKHIIEYRRKNLHITREPFPHLFIIIDEFAEMVAENPEYKSQLDSITRLGRAIGVSLILATQRPAGMITDQMRANMKFKICLRVETPDDSRELLRRSDAAYLPPSIPGRAYLQIGNEPPELLQVARAGGPYRVSGQAEIPKVVFMDRKRKTEKEEERNLSSMMVEHMEKGAKDPDNNIATQSKPWPDPLPAYLPLAAPLDRLESVDTRYIVPEQNDWLQPFDPDKEEGEATSQHRYLNWRLALWAMAVYPAATWEAAITQETEGQTRGRRRRNKQQETAPEGDPLLRHLPNLKAQLDVLWAQAPDLETWWQEQPVIQQQRAAVAAAQQAAQAGPDAGQAVATTTADMPASEGWSPPADGLPEPLSRWYRAQSLRMPQRDDKRKAKSKKEVPPFQQFLNRYPFLLRLLLEPLPPTVIDDLNNRRNASPVHQHEAYQEAIYARRDTRNEYVRAWQFVNEPLVSYLSNFPERYTLIKQHPVLMHLLDCRPQLTYLLTLDPTLRDYMPQMPPAWQDWSWQSDEVFEVVMGLVDHPRAAQQRVIRFGLLDGHIAVFGSGGWGKTTFLRTLVASLVAVHPPDALHIYCLDFGGRNFDIFLDLPHMGAVIRPEEEDRINRLLRYVDREIEHRKQRFAEVQADNIVDYNRNATDNNVEPVPGILVIIDNFAEIRENFESLLPVFVSLLREGRNYGIFFAASGDLPSSMGGKIFNQFTQRVSLHLIERTEYSGIVGRTSLGVPEIAGRGLMGMERNISPTALEVHIALPVALRDDELVYEDRTANANASKRLDRERTLAHVGRVMARRLESGLVRLMYEQAHKAYATKIWPKPIDVLPLTVRWFDEWEAHRRMVAEPQADHAVTNGRSNGRVPAPTGNAAMAGYPVLFAIEDDELQPEWIDIEQHFIIIGPPLSGRTTTLRTWIFALAAQYSPQEVAIVVIDPLQRLLEYGGEYSLDHLPHVLDVISNEEDVVPFLQRLKFEYDCKRPLKPEAELTDEDRQARDEELQKLVEKARERITTQYAESGEEGEPELPPDVTDPQPLPVGPRPEIYIFIDNYDDLEDITPSKMDFVGELGELARLHGRGAGLHFILCGTDELMKSKTNLQKQAWLLRRGLALKATKMVDTLGGKVPRSLRDTDLNNGRGYLVQSGQSTLVQVLTLDMAGDDPTERVSREIERISNRHFAGAYEWYYDRVPEALRPLQDLAKAATSSRTSRTERLSPLQGKFKATESEAHSVEKSVEHNRNHPLRDLLTGEALAKLPPSLVVELKVDLSHMAPRLTPQTLLRERVRDIAGWVNSGAIVLPTEPVADELRQKVETALHVFDTLIGPRGEQFVKYPMAMLQALGVQFNPEAIIAAEKAEAEAAAKAAAEAAAQAGADAPPAKPVDDLSTSDVAPDEPLTPQMMRLGTFDQLRKWLAMGGLILPDELSDAQQAQLMQRQAVYDLLPARRLQLLDAEHLALLPVTPPLTIDGLRRYSAKDLQTAIDSEQVPLPDALDEATYQRIETFIEQNNMVLASEIPLPFYRAMTPALLEAFGMTLQGITVTDLQQSTPQQVKEWLQGGQLQPPEKVSIDVFNQLKDRINLLQQLSAANLVKMSPAILRDTGIDWGDLDVAQVPQMDTDTLNEALQSGQITLPETLSDELQQRMRDRNDVLRRLNARTLIDLPPDVLQRLGVQTVGLMYADIYEKDKAVVEKALRDGKIILPDVLTETQHQLIKDAQAKALEDRLKK